MSQTGAESSVDGFLDRTNRPENFITGYDATRGNPVFDRVLTPRESAPDSS